MLSEGSPLQEVPFQQRRAKSGHAPWEDRRGRGPEAGPASGVAWRRLFSEGCGVWTAVSQGGSPWKGGQREAELRSTCDHRKRRGSVLLVCWFVYFLCGIESHGRILCGGAGGR